MNDKPLLTRLISQPLLQFLVLAALILLVDINNADVDDNTIVIDQKLVDLLVQQQQRMTLTSLSEQEKQAVVAQYVEDEILLREAYKMGLEQDGGIRRQLILKMRGLMQDEIADPSEEELLQFYLDNPERFMRPETAELNQLFYPLEARVPADLLLLLSASDEPQTLAPKSVLFPYLRDNISLSDLQMSFASNDAQAVFQTPLEQWSGPYTTSRGTHFFRIIQLTPAQALGYEEVQHFIRQDWLMLKKQKSSARRLAKMRRQYQVIHKEG